MTGGGGPRTIAVTGGRGKAGVAVVDHLNSLGYDVRSIDIAEPLDPDRPSLNADLTDLGQTIEALSGCDAVVHLAAIPAPGILTEGETFRINILSTYNVFTAAVQLGMSRIVWASSETLIGLPFAFVPPAYAPIDEAHPVLPQSHYAMSKMVGETMAATFARWSGVPFVALRISNIMTEADYARFPSFWDDPRLRAWNLWGYVDARDVAHGVHRGLDAAVTGADAFLIAAPDTCMTATNHDLLAAVYPDVPVRGEVGDHTTLLSIDKARTIIGYAPEHSWRDHLSP
jgi:nucleoside-diphosphate-sugar epimerase